MPCPVGTVQRSRAVNNCCQIYAMGSGGPPTSCGRRATRANCRRILRRALRGLTTPPLSWNRWRWYLRLESTPLLAPLEQRRRARAARRKRWTCTPSTPRAPTLRRRSSGDISARRSRRTCGRFTLSKTPTANHRRPLPFWKRRCGRTLWPEVCQAIGHVFPESVRKAFGEHVGENEHEEEEE